jgi:hypothetical protein
MENHIQPDKLDDFVRKSFENYEENPPEDRWNKIVVALDQPNMLPLTPQKPVFAWKSTLAIAAIILLSIGLVTEYFYFSNKISEISKIAGKNTEIPPVSIDKKKLSQDNNALQNTINEPRKIVEERKEVFFKNDFSQPRTIIDGVAQSHPINTQIPEIDGVAQSDSINTQIPQIIRMTQSGLVNVQALSTPFEQINKVTNVEQLPLPTINSFMKVKEISLLVQNTEIESIQNQENSLQIATIPVKPFKNPTNWYLTATVNSRYEQNQREGNQNGNPDNHLDVRSEYRKKYKQDYAINIGKKINRRVGFETGLGFLKSNTVTSHSPDLKKRDGRPHGGGGHGGPGGGSHDSDLDLDYKLHTYGGVATVSLRMTQIDTSVLLNDDEPFNLKVSTQENIQILRIPLLATYAFGKGRWLLNTKIGLNANIFLKNNLEITGLDAQSLIFKPEPDHRPMSSFQNSSKVKLAFLASAGLEYRLNQHFSLIAEPIFTRDFQSQNEVHKFQPNHIALGLNAGVKVRI